MSYLRSTPLQYGSATILGRKHTTTASPTLPLSTSGTRGMCQGWRLASSASDGRRSCWLPWRSQSTDGPTSSNREQTRIVSLIAEDTTLTDANLLPKQCGRRAFTVRRRLPRVQSGRRWSERRSRRLDGSLSQCLYTTSTRFHRTQDCNFRFVDYVPVPALLQNRTQPSAPELANEPFPNPLEGFQDTPQTSSCS